MQEEIKQIECFLINTYPYDKMKLVKWLEDLEKRIGELEKIACKSCC